MLGSFPPSLGQFCAAKFTRSQRSRRCYPIRMRLALLHACGLLFVALSVWAQSPPSSPSGMLSIATKALPPASLWNPYSSDHQRGVRLHAEQGLAPYHWRILGGSLPQGLELEEFGEISGAPQQAGQFSFTIVLRDSNNPPVQVQQKFILNVETPFVAEWDRKAQVNGQRIDGSIKVSNRSGRDFDLTFIVLAVNDFGRATAIGYQHFPLKANTRSLPLPFGDNLSPGNYTVNVDLVAEEPISNRIFRTRLVTPKQPITQGP
jgi:Putative Ig domain